MGNRVNESADPLGLCQVLSIVLRKIVSRL